MADVPYAKRRDRGKGEGDERSIPPFHIGFKARCSEPGNRKASVYADRHKAVSKQKPRKNQFESPRVRAESMGKRIFQLLRRVDTSWGSFQPSGAAHVQQLELTCRPVRSRNDSGNRGYKGPEKCLKGGAPSMDKTIVSEVLSSTVRHAFTGASQTESRSIMASG
ncbi:hypothetical protein B0H13DRAFT_1870343 [Mycena leptocephala]|nr:hypothetical protein B0H13DRAFT_1870343 [Mycena leptocephala]